MPKQSGTKWKIDWKLIVAIIVVILTVFVIVYGNNLCQQVNPPSWTIPILNKICPTNHTPTPTPSPIPTPLPTTTVQVNLCLQPGDDWKCNCISMTNWQTYSDPTESFIQNDCWNLSQWGIAAEQGQLLIVAERNRGSTNQEQYVRRGILTPLSTSSTITFVITITELSTNYADQLTNLTIGVIPSNPIDPTSGVRIIYQMESAGVPIAIKLNERGSAQEYLPLSYSLGQKHNIRVETTSVSVSIYVDGSLEVGPEPLPLNPALWIGYLLPTSGKINATISSLSVVTK